MKPLDKKVFVSTDLELQIYSYAFVEEEHCEFLVGTLHLSTLMNKVTHCIQCRIYIVKFWTRAPLPGPNSFNFVQFLGKLGKFRPHLGEILDPPLAYVLNNNLSRHPRGNLGEGNTIEKGTNILKLKSEWQFE